MHPVHADVPRMAVTGQNCSETCLDRHLPPWSIRDCREYLSIHAGLEIGPDEFVVHLEAEYDLESRRGISGSNKRLFTNDATVADELPRSSGYEIHQSWQKRSHRRTRVTQDTEQKKASNRSNRVLSVGRGQRRLVNAV